ncbi:MAG: RNA 3'-terminal phosphate cyclase [bacterium]
MRIPPGRLRLLEGCIRIDASYGEGGGQIVRTACALSALTGLAVQLSQIRAHRRQPGLRPQHCAAVRGLAQLCGATATPLKPGLAELTFTPGTLQGKELSLDTGTAGSVGLVLQGLLLASLGLSAPTRYLVRGGTDVPFGPSSDYIQSVKRRMLSKMGYRFELRLIRRGYYPKGGGIVEATVKPPERSLLTPLHLPPPSAAAACCGISFASNELAPRRVAERQRRWAAKKLTEYFHVPAKISDDYGASHSPGSGLLVWLEAGDSILGASSLGRAGKASEQVAEEATEHLLKTYHSQASVDPWLGDQILPYLALSSGPSKISVPYLTRHMQTNMWLIRKFLNVRFEVEDQGSFVSVGCFPEDVG